MFHRLNRSLRVLTALLFLCIATSGCAHRDDVVTPRWLTGTAQENFHAVERHFGGFGGAMWEVGYRYIELYWAGVDGNWPYALHQLEEMEEAIELAVERRPARAKAATVFLGKAVPVMEEALESQDPETFGQAFDSFTQACNACHVAEDHAFIWVTPPEVRLSPVRKP